MGEAARLLERHLAPGLRLLHVGCGDGELTRALGEHVAPGRVVGVDADAARMRDAAEAARSSCSTQVRFETADADDLPFDDASFERVLVERLPPGAGRTRDVLLEALRVLAPGGILAVQGPPLRPWAELLASAGAEILEADGDAVIIRR